MIEKNENKRQQEVIEAINYGLLNKDIVKMVDEFSEKHSLNKSCYFNGIVDPGIKSTNSIISKLYRKYIIEENKDFSLVDIKDIIRCSIIVDNYNQVIPLIRELRKAYPSLKGDISENETGYIGIHLFFSIKGLKAEMQISTRESWYAKQAGESIYEKWRNFNFTKEFSEIYNYKDKYLKGEKLDQLFSQYTLRCNDLICCQSMFSRLHKYTNLIELKDKINAVLCVNNLPEEELPIHIHKKYSIKITDKDSLKSKCESYAAYATKIKDELIKYANKALQLVKKQQLSNNICLTEDEKVFIYLKKKYYDFIIKKMSNIFKKEFNELNYVSTINKISNKQAFEALYKLKNLQDIKTLLNADFDKEYQQNIKQLEERIRIEIITKLKLHLLQTSN